MPVPLRRPPFAESLGMLGVLAALVALFGALSPHFLSATTLATVANQVPALTVVAVGMTFVLVVAGIDLSVGSAVALSGALVGVAMAEWGWGVAPATALAVAAGLAVGLVNGAVTVRWAVPSFIVTLGTLEAARGAAYLITDSRALYVGSGVGGVGAPVAGLGLSPAFAVAVAVVVAGQLVLSRTVFGRYAIAVGTNEEAVRLAGVDPRPVKAAVFALSGALSGLGGLFHVAYLETADPNAGLGLELSAIAAVVIGGTSLMGGRGNVAHSFLGVLVIAVLQAGLAQLGASEPTKRVVTGAVIVLAVVADAVRSRAARRRAGRA